MHLTARRQSLSELLRVVRVKHDESSQFLSSKVKKYEIQKKYLKFLYKFNSLEECMKNIDLSKVFLAITKSNDIHKRDEDISDVFEAYKDYVIQASGQLNGILENSQFDNNKVDDIDHELTDKIEQGIKKFSKKYGLMLLNEEFERNIKTLIYGIKSFIKEMKKLAINDINESRNHLNCLKTQVEFVLQSKWILQKHLLQFDEGLIANKKGFNLYGGTKVLSMTGQSQLLFDHIQDTMFHLRILEEMEFNKHFYMMSRLCELRERKDYLIATFRNFITRVGHQLMKLTPKIKRNLLELNKEIQVLFSDYQKLRLQFQFLNSPDAKKVKNRFEDIEAVVIADTKAFKEKKSVGQAKFRKLNRIEAEVAQKKTEDSIEDIIKSVEESMEFLHSLDETLISKEFAVMRYLCELHSIKEQILSSFENLLSSMFKLSVEDDEQILNRLNHLKTTADGLVKKYETIGTQLMLFSDIMTMMNREVETLKFEEKLQEDSRIKISELFGPTDDIKKLHYDLDEAIKYKWFPSKMDLFDILKDKEQTIQDFQNFIDRMPELDIHNTLDTMHYVRKLIINAENVLRSYLRLRMQLIWIVGDCVFNVKNI